MRIISYDRWACILALVLTIIGTFAAQERPKLSLGAYYVQGMQGFQSKQFDNAASSFTQAAALAPDHAEIFFYVSRAHALAGNKTEAIEWLNKLLDFGMGLDAATHPDFGALRYSNEWKPVKVRLDRLNRPIGRSQTAFTIREKNLIPEGIAYDPGGRNFYLSSINKRKVISVDEKGRVRDFTSEGQDDLWRVLGLKVDSKRNLLWVNCYAGPEIKASHGSAAVHKYDLISRKLIKKYVMSGNKDERHLFNDLTITTRGDVYLTDSENGAVYRIAEEKDQLEEFIQSGQFIYPNGITLSSDEGLLFISDWSRGISVIRIADRSVTKLARPKNVTLFGIDGLYFYRGDLVAVQNSIKPERVVRFRMNRELDHIINADILDANNSAFSIPTTGVLVKDDFYFIANSHLDSYQDGSILPGKESHDVVILRARLSVP